MSDTNERPAYGIWILDIRKWMKDVSGQLFVSENVHALRAYLWDQAEGQAWERQQFGKVIDKRTYEIRQIAEDGSPMTESL